MTFPTFPFVIANEKYVYIFKSKWTLWPICIERSNIEDALSYEKTIHPEKELDGQSDRTN